MRQVLAGDGFAFLLASFLSLSDTALRKAKFLNSSTSTRRVRHYVVATAAVVGVVMYSGRAGWAHAKSRLRFGFGFGFGDDGHGLTMHRYGESLLATLPTNALLISHTDLDWNTVRREHSFSTLAFFCVSIITLLLCYNYDMLQS